MDEKITFFQRAQFGLIWRAFGADQQPKTHFYIFLKYLSQNY